ncbi:MAG: sulfatase [Caulobacteraceae bacterium]|nr:sulfatase [Caulobacteraceae bacterium]
MASPLNRRDLLAASAASALALGAGAGRAATTRRPNIVFLLADDMGVADISIYGRPDFKTPNIDRLGAEGVRLSQAYANSPVCSASRTALITGRYQYRLPVGLEEPIAGAHPAGLPPSHPTLPSLLKKAGYATTLVGKWHLGALPAYGPLQSGYDHFYGFRGGALDYYSHAGVDGRDDLWDDDTPVHHPGYLTQLLGDRAVDVIDRHAQSAQPFLLSLHFNAPHWPWEAPGDEAESARVSRTNLRDWDGGDLRTYQRMVQAMDQQVGRVLQALDRHDLTQDTIVVFTSDNGGERFADTWPFNGRKTELLEGGVRVPALVRWPARLPGGRVCDQVGMTMDWLPTLLAAGGAAPDPAYPTDGIDLMPALAGQAAPVPRALFWRYKANWQRSARIGDLKYLKILDNEFLFDVVADPQERANLKSRRAADFERLGAAWMAWNAGMLPEIAESFTEGFDGDQLADHIGSPKASLQPDPALAHKP